jgi:2-dehydrotetronate isomerase
MQALIRERGDAVKLSANLGFLWTGLSLPDAIRAAKAAGFDAVECHFPYQYKPAEISAVLGETGMPMLGLNTVPGNPGQGDFGLCALPGREAEARDAIDEAVGYAEAIGCRNVHAMAGKSGGGTEAEAVFRANLAFACEKASAAGLTILIEPINLRDAPGYHLSTVEHAAEIIADLGHPNLRIMFDCYHVEVMQGDVIGRIERHMPIIGHIQIAAVPSRREPDEGTLDYRAVAGALRTMGYDGYLGAEYRPRASTEAGLVWMGALQAV